MVGVLTTTERQQNNEYVSYRLRSRKIARDVCEYSLRHTTEELKSKLLKINELRDRGVYTDP